MSSGVMPSAREGPAERQEQDLASPWWGEHISRYQWAVPYVHGKIVLDAACGTGYGVRNLAEAGAARVIGVDIDPDTVAEAVRVYGDGPVGYLLGDTTRLPFHAQTFEVVTSFETIEHVADFMAYLCEFRRVLKEDGLFLCSTPNKAITSPDGIVQNPYHVREFTVSEFREALSGVFSEVRILGQWCRRELMAPLASRLVWQGLTLRGVRKLPWSVREAVSQLLTHAALFPAGEEFAFTPDVVGVPTLIGICRKSGTLAERVEIRENSREEKV